MGAKIINLCRCTIENIIPESLLNNSWSYCVLLKLRSLKSKKNSKNSFKNGSWRINQKWDFQIGFDPPCHCIPFTIRAGGRKMNWIRLSQSSRHRKNAWSGIIFSLSLFERCHFAWKILDVKLVLLWWHVFLSEVEEKTTGSGQHWLLVGRHKSFKKLLFKTQGCAREFSVWCNSLNLHHIQLCKDKLNLLLKRNSISYAMILCSKTRT